nr:MAG TPA: hypothetical protein [Caudoviricetes sp.]
MAAEATRRGLRCFSILIKIKQDAIPVQVHTCQKELLVIVVLMVVIIIKLRREN